MMSMVFRVIAIGLMAAAMGGHPGGEMQQNGPPSSTTEAVLSDELLKELRAIRALLSSLGQPKDAPPVPTSARVSNLSGHALGKADAPLTLIEFSDLQCPFCQRYATTTFEEIKKNWIDTGKLRYIVKDFPLDFHPLAIPAARAARCAGEQGRFWEVRLALMRASNALTPENIRNTVVGLGLDVEAFDECSSSTKHDADIRAELTEALTLGVTGTPTFVVGTTAVESIEGAVMVGALPYSMFDAKFREVLAGKK
jgi:protein-disulfide isomerase